MSPAAKKPTDPGGRHRNRVPSRPPTKSDLFPFLLLLVALPSVLDFSTPFTSSPANILSTWLVVVSSHHHPSRHHVSQERYVMLSHRTDLAGC